MGWVEDEVQQLDEQQEDRGPVRPGPFAVGQVRSGQARAGRTSGHGIVRRVGPRAHRPRSRDRSQVELAATGKARAAARYAVLLTGALLYLYTIACCKPAGNTANGAAQYRYLASMQACKPPAPGALSRPQARAGRFLAEIGQSAHLVRSPPPSSLLPCPACPSVPPSRTHHPHPDEQWPRASDTPSPPRWQRM